MGETPHLVPSRYEAPEPPELGSPAPTFPADALVELLRECVVPRSWESDLVSVEARNGYLHVRNTRPVLDAIWTNLDQLQREFLWTLATKTEVVEVDSALACRLVLSAGTLLDDAARGELKAALAGGKAERLGTARVKTMHSSRGHITQGERISYLSDYEVEVSEAAAASRPVIQSCLSGSVLDFEGEPTVGSQSVHATVRFTQTKIHTPLRKLSTPHGEIDVPEMDVFRVRATMRVPLGETMVLASAGTNGRHRLLLLTSYLRRSGRK
jgi:hypothetical protein